MDRFTHSSHFLDEKRNQVEQNIRTIIPEIYALQRKEFHFSDSKQSRKPHCQGICKTVSAENGQKIQCIQKCMSTSILSKEAILHIMKHHERDHAYLERKKPVKTMMMRLIYEPQSIDFRAKSDMVLLEHVFTLPVALEIIPDSMWRLFLIRLEHFTKPEQRRVIHQWFIRQADFSSSQWKHLKRKLENFAPKLLESLEEEEQQFQHP